MTYSLQYLRQFMRAWQPEAATTLIFFPDQKVGMSVGASLDYAAPHHAGGSARAAGHRSRAPTPAARPEMAPFSMPTPSHFPPQEMQVALRGKAMDPNAGSWTIDPVFDGSSFKFGYLVRPASHFVLMGIE